MDIDCNDRYYDLLLTLLNDVERSVFVAVDLELSGVPVKPPRRPGQASGQHSLQQRYRETKAAAEKYHILQIGVTFVHYESEYPAYVCKPYNIPISPLLEHDSFHIERDVTFSSSAANFLTGVYFDFQKTFTDGITYLRHDEEVFARHLFRDTSQRATGGTLGVNEAEKDAIAYLEQTRKTIKTWLSSKDPHKDKYLNIGPPAFDVPGSEPAPEMTRKQKWLTHQLVQVEFPQLRSFPKRGFVQINYLDQDREARILAEKTAEFDARLARQKGFGWLIEALLGHDIPAPLLAQCIHHSGPEEEDGPKETLRSAKIREQVEAACRKLKGHTTVLVGHNCFLDLVYLYHNFIGPLPDSVEDFAEQLHQSFPMIVDTKYLATQNAGDMAPNSSLEELARQLEIEGERGDFGADDRVDEDFSKYEGTDFQYSHEAGFDSLLTAQVAIRLSQKLEAAGRYVEAPDDGGVSLSAPRHSNILASAMDKSVSAVTALLPSLGINGDQKTSSESQRGMPSFDSDFWRVYGNHLRAFGTAEGLLSLDPVAP